MTIRAAQPGDEHAIMSLIHALALYEKAPEQVKNTASDLATHLFEEKICAALVVEIEQQIVGFALYYTNYSTWKGKCLYLEDFIVTEKMRGQGIGKLLFDRVVQETKDKGFSMKSSSKEYLLADSTCLHSILYSYSVPSA
jgi:GNAT superfamily N-acetyltransferase